ncbi:Aspartate/glutamate/uridylate kinase [Mycena rosella]|uniref:Aspartate/glutamate/uridylate kinase n=1 Tax=Mycena rosella TaxID=1033263 RepID=A0AAD7CPJ3_MYCRO|nr:Aspartate/glutamate/uridylate kinase [Mycena rosella]
MARVRHPCTIVIKLGRQRARTHQPLLSTLSAVVETVVHLRQQGHKRMNMASRPKSLSGKQALAAIGQGRLIALWDNLFGQLEQPIAQVLLTRGTYPTCVRLEATGLTVAHLPQRTRYLNAVNTFKELLSMGVVPIVNENDTVSVSEIKFGDNDTLSAVTSSMLHADYLFLLTDVDGLYTSNPRKDPFAKQIEVVTSIATIRSQVSTTTLGSSLGTGGMETKLIAAEIATGAGVTTIISSSKNPESIFGIIEYHIAQRSMPGTPSETVSGWTIPTVEPTDPITPALIRPPHTVFTASVLPMRDLKSWTSHTLFPAGSVIIDSGAHNVLSRRESGGRLLAAGVHGVIGAFASGQAVRILIRRRPEGSGADDSAARMPALLETRPPTPTLVAASSMSSSITSLEPLSRSISSVSLSEMKVGSPADELSEADVVEVGRGLANYNSAQILKVKGLNSSYMAQMLGYADSEYVVENITIRVPP